MGGVRGGGVRGKERQKNRRKETERERDIYIYIYKCVYIKRSREVKRAGTNWGKGRREGGRQRERERERERERKTERQSERERSFSLRGRGGLLLGRVLGGGARKNSPGNLTPFPPSPPGTHPNGSHHDLSEQNGKIQRGKKLTKK